MCRQPGKTWQGNTGEVACDHYHRFPEDVRLMSEIGLQAYRFSISWTRVLPEGTGPVNAKGLAFYDRLVDTLLENGVEPWVTLFHWDYPYALYLRGGWLNRDSAGWFADYAAVVVDRLSDRVSHWMTHNEPQVVICNGHQTGYHAPGLRLSFGEVLQVAHHSLLAHGRAVQAIRANARNKLMVGAALWGSVKIRASDHPADIEAARDSVFSVTALNCWNNTWFADPMIFGRYPDDGVSLFRNALPVVQAGDMAVIALPPDFYGVNIYGGKAVRAAGSAFEEVEAADGHPLSALGWAVCACESVLGAQVPL